MPDRRLARDGRHGAADPARPGSRRLPARHLCGQSRVHRPTRDQLEKIAHLFPTQPILLSEFGTIGVPRSGGDVRFSEDYQAAYVSAVWQAVMDVPEISGGVVWCWADYRQRRGFTNDFPAFFGPFGVVRFDRTPKKALATLRTQWKGQPPTRLAYQ